MSTIMAEEEESDHIQVLIASQTRPRPYFRLDTPDPTRILFASTIAIAIGAIPGAITGGRAEALRFRAENAHRLPTSTKGWYLYHKSKNYTVMFSSIKAGARHGAKLGFWVGVFLLSESLVDRIWNRRKDFRSTALVGLLTGLGWSRFHGMSHYATRRMLMLGLKAGLAYGLLQDAVGVMDGHKFDYLRMFSTKDSKSP